MWTSIRYILLCALRDRLFTGLIAGIIIVSGISALLGSTAMIEEKEMMLSFAGGATRLLLAVGLSVFVCFHVRSSFDNREIDVMLSRPLSRARLALAFWLGFAAVASLLILPAALALGAITPLSWPGFAGWVLSLLLESWLIVALALFASLALRSAVTSVLAALGFYVLSRMMAFFAMTAHAMRTGGIGIALCKYALTGISLLVPRLDFFAKTEWLVYGFSGMREIWLFAVQALVFLPLLVTACIVDFRRKQF